jgi:hypothetical protein
MKPLMRALLPAATALVVGLGLALPAQAAASTCYFSIVRLGNDSCTTATIPANRNGHYVYLEVSSGARWEVYDVVTDVRVGTGQTGLRFKRKTIFGLYGSYKLEAHGLAGYATLNNT